MNSMSLSFSTSHSLYIYIYSRGLVMRYTYMYSFKCGAIERNEVDLDWVYLDISFIHSLKVHMVDYGPPLPPTSSSSSTTVGTYSIHSLKSIDSLIRYFGNGFLDSQCISSDHINRQTLCTVIFHNFYYSSCDVLNFLHIGCVS